MKRLFLLICIIITFSNYTFATELTDIQNHWAKESIYRLIDADSINGYEDGTFKIDNNITVAEFLKVIVEYADYKKVLEGERWPDWYINTAINNNLILKDEFENYDSFISRSDACTILARFINVDDVKKSKKYFSDNLSEVVLKLASLGVVNGYEDNSFRGDNLITRAEACVIICRAMQAKRKLVSIRKYDIDKAESLTNIGRTPSYNSEYRNRYEIKNDRLYFYDDGRYAKLDGFSVDNKVIDNKKLVDLIKCLIQEDAYVGVSYIPDDLTYDQITINYGKREGYVYNNSYAFGFTFYPNKQFELRKSSLNDNLSDECFMKITVAKMWKDVYDMKNGEYSNEYNNEKLSKALNAIFDKKTAKELYGYIQELLPELFENGLGKQFVEVKKIGKYEVNLYTSGNSRIQLYISK